MTRCSADDLRRRIGELLDRATFCQTDGRFGDADLLVADARCLATGNVQACAEIDLFCATALLERGNREQGLQALESILARYGEWLKTAQGRAAYELVQVQRAFSLMHLQRNLEARPLLEEATQFQIDAKVRSDVHCHLGRCYHELSLDTWAKEQFECANALGVSEEWQPVFHYCYGYTLYKLKEFQRAKREFILCLQSGSSGPEPALRYSMLAATSRRLGEYAEARTYEERAKALKL
jgi:tetratricopeptide (TPR) repeat protein